MCTRCSPNPDPADNLTANLNWEPAPEYEDLIVHIAKSLKSRHLVDQFGQFGRRTSETTRGIRLFPAAIDRMRRSTIGSAHGAKHTGSIHNRDAHPIAIFIAGV